MDHVTKGTDTKRDAEGNDQLQSTNVGLLGLGDENYAIGAEFFAQMAKQKAFIQNMSTEWKAKNSQPHACDAVDPPTRTIFKQCAGYCVATACQEQNLDESEVLHLVNRDMKDLYESIKKEIGRHARHPLLFVRMVLPTGEFESRAWLLTRAAFKPRLVDGISVYAHGEAFQSLVAPFDLYIGTNPLPGSDQPVPSFVSMDEIAVEMACLRKLFPDGKFEYCYKPCYKLSSSRPLTLLQVIEPLRWVAQGQLDFEDSDNDDDDADSDGGDQAEQDDIDDMVSLLTGGKNKNDKTGGSQKRTSTTNDGSNNGNTNTGATVTKTYENTKNQDIKQDSLYSLGTSISTLRATCVVLCIFDDIFTQD